MAVGVVEAWKREMDARGGKEQLDVVAFMLLVGVYGVADRFDAKKIFHLFFMADKRLLPFPEVCQALGLRDMTRDTISKLTSRGKITLAVRYVYAFGLKDKFSVVPLLEDYLMYCKNFAQNTDQSKLNVLRLHFGPLDSEIQGVRTVMDIVKCYKLESEYLKEDLVMQLAMLQKKKRREKQAASPRAYNSSRHCSKLQKLSQIKYRG